MSCVVYGSPGGGEHRLADAGVPLKEIAGMIVKYLGVGNNGHESISGDIYRGEQRTSQSLNQSLLQREEPGDRPTLNEIFRVAHTIKGMAGTMGFNKMSKLTHDMENVLHALRNDEIEITADLVDILFKCLDALEGYTVNIVETGNEGSGQQGTVGHPIRSACE